MESRFNQILTHFLKWRIKNLNDRRFAIILSLAIGIVVGLAAVVLKWMIANIENQIQEGTLSTIKNYFYFGLPMIGIGLTILFVRYFMKGNLPSGISYLLYRIGRKNSRISKKHNWGHLVGSALTVGFGGSVGIEGPIVLTGSSIGSTLGELMHLNRRQKMLLIGCGSSAAIAAIFNAPVAGVLFTLEVILAEMKVGLLVPLLISSVTGVTISKLLVGDQNTFYFQLVEKIQISDYPIFILLGLLCGLLSVYFMRVSAQFLKRTNKIENKTKAWITGGIMLGGLILLFPSLFGEGYWTLKAILEGKAESIVEGTLYGDFDFKKSILLGFIFLTILLKPIATSITRMSGGIGGVFAPSLLMGGLSGFLISRLVNISGITTVSEQNFTLVGMAGIASGVLHSPLTSIFLIAELTDGYELFVPLMIVAAIAYGTSYYFERHSFYTKALAERGDLIVHDRDKTVLTTIGVKQVLERDLVPVKINGDLSDLVEAISKSKRNIFPVIDEEGYLKGIITLDDVRHIIFKPEVYASVGIKDVMKAPLDTIDYYEPMDFVMEKFDHTGAWNLPVILKGKYIGFVSKSKIFNSYRKRLQTETEM